MKVFRFLWARKLFIVGVLGILALFALAFAQPQRPTPPVPPITIQIGEGREGFVTALRIMLLLTILTLAPSILIMITSFTRIIIVLLFLRQALALHQTPPTQVIAGLALFLTFFVMRPAFEIAYEDAFRPYVEGKMNEEEFLREAFQPFRKFMLAQVREEELALFVKISGSERPRNPDNISATTLVPAFIVSELRTAFEIGFLIFIPFLMIDVVIASILMAMGMIMVPPIMLSLPFKVIVFVLADGWTLLVHSLVKSFRI